MCSITLQPVAADTESRVAIEADARSGGFLAHSIDYAAPSPSLLRIERVYQQIGGIRGGGWFGYGWGSRYETYLQLRANGSIAAHDYGQPGVAVVFEPADGALRGRDQIVGEIMDAAQKLRRFGSESDKAAYNEELRTLDDAGLESAWEEYYKSGLVDFPSRVIGTIFYDRPHEQRLVRVSTGYQRSLIGEVPKRRTQPGGYDGDSEDFNALGMLTRVWNANHEFVSIRYDESKYMMALDIAQNRPFELADSQGRRLKLDWSGAFSTPNGYVEQLIRVREAPAENPPPRAKVRALQGHVLATYSYVYKQKPSDCGDNGCYGRYLTGFRDFGGQVLGFSYSNDGLSGELPSLAEVRYPDRSSLKVASPVDNTDTNIRVISVTQRERNGGAREQRLLYLYSGEIGKAPLEEVISTGNDTTTDTLYDSSGKIISTVEVRGSLDELKGKTAAFHNRLGDLFLGLDDAMALAEYRLAADQGDPDGQMNLGRMYASGKGTAKDSAKALTLFRSAADQGNAKSEMALGLMYEQGRDVDKNCTLAKHYYQLAAQRGVPAARSALEGWACGAQIAVLLGHEDRVWSAAFSPDGTRIVTASVDKTARLWDAKTGAPLAVLRGHEGTVFSAAFSPDGTRIVTASQDKTARLWDAKTGAPLAVLRGHEGAVFSAAFSPDGARIVTASVDKTARLWDAKIGAPLAVFRGHENAVLSAAFSPDGTRIVAASEDKTARLWDAKTAAPLAVFRGHEGAVLSAAFSPDGTRIVTASMDTTARVWDAKTAAPLAVLRGHEGAVLSAAFSPDGTRIVTASADKTARVWDARTMALLAALRGHEGAVLCAGFSQDGTRVVTSSSDKTARIWRANGEYSLN